MKRQKIIRSWENWATAEEISSIWRVTKRRVLQIIADMTFFEKVARGNLVTMVLDERGKTSIRNIPIYKIIDFKIEESKDETG